MIQLMRETIRTFEEVFSEYKTSGYKIPENLQPGIDWYNANIYLIGFAHNCPMQVIQDITRETYIWAFSAGLITCAHMNYRITTTQ